MSLLSAIMKYNKSRKPPTCTAVIAAAGTSQRCRGEDKLFYIVNGKPIIAYTIDIFQKCKFIDDIIIVTREDQYERIGEICQSNDFSKVSCVIKGGETRAKSVYNGIFAASAKAHLVAIHDGARPCIDDELLEKTIKTAAKYNAAAPAVAVTSTLKRVNNEVISETVSREDLYEIQTPQIFRIELIKAALTKVIKNSIEITDDCMAVELIGMPVHITEGSRRNIKITENTDLHMVEDFLLNQRISKI